MVDELARLMADRVSTHTPQHVVDIVKSEPSTTVLGRTNRRR
jgi:hypothetical protein